jgi:hypothetical protein
MGKKNRTDTNSINHRPDVWGVSPATRAAIKKMLKSGASHTSVIEKYSLFVPSTVLTNIVNSIA